MPEDEIGERIQELEDELADLKAIHGANEDLRRDAESDEPFGIDRLRQVRRKDDYPNHKETDE